MGRIMKGIQIQIRAGMTIWFDPYPRFSNTKSANVDAPTLSKPDPMYPPL